MNKKKRFLTAFLVTTLIAGTGAFGSMRPLDISFGSFGFISPAAFSINQHAADLFVAPEYKLERRAKSIVAQLQAITARNNATNNQSSTNEADQTKPPRRTVSQALNEEFKELVQAAQTQQVPPAGLPSNQERTQALRQALTAVAVDSQGNGPSEQQTAGSGLQNQAQQPDPASKQIGDQPPANPAKDALAGITDPAAHSQTQTPPDISIFPDDGNGGAGSGSGVGAVADKTLAITQTLTPITTATWTAVASTPIDTFIPAPATLIPTSTPPPVDTVAPATATATAIPTATARPAVPTPVDTVAPAPATKRPARPKEPTRSPTQTRSPVLPTATWTPEPPPVDTVAPATATATAIPTATARPAVPTPVDTVAPATATATAIPTATARPAVPTPVDTVAPATATATAIPTDTPIPPTLIPPTPVPVLVTSRTTFAEWLTEGAPDGTVTLDGVDIGIAAQGDGFAARGWEISNKGAITHRSSQSGTIFTFVIPEGVESVRLGLGEMDVNHVERLYSFSAAPTVTDPLIFSAGVVQSTRQNADGVMAWDGFSGDLTFITEIEKGLFRFDFIEITRMHENVH